jgi:hypothetical protein
MYSALMATKNTNIYVGEEALSKVKGFKTPFTVIREDY